MDPAVKAVLESCIAENEADRHVSNLQVDLDIHVRSLFIQLHVHVYASLEFHVFTMRSQFVEAVLNMPISSRLHVRCNK